jgi:hypothetical protein
MNSTRSRVPPPASLITDFRSDESDTTTKCAAKPSLFEMAVWYLHDGDPNPGRNMDEIWLTTVPMPRWGTDDEWRQIQKRHQAPPLLYEIIAATQGRKFCVLFHLPSVTGSVALALFWYLLTQIQAQARTSPLARDATVFLNAADLHFISYVGQNPQVEAQGWSMGVY